MPINPRISGRPPTARQVDRQIRDITERRERLITERADLDRLIERIMMKLTNLERARTKLEC